MKRGLIFLSVVGLVFCGVASASVQQGDTELGFSGGFWKLNGGTAANDSESIFLSAALGYFFTDNVQGEVVGTASWQEVNDNYTDLYGIGVRGKYHFMPTNQWVPYVGAQLLYVDAEGDEIVGNSGISVTGSGTLWGPLVGLRYELNANNDFYAEYQYQIWDGNLGTSYDDGHLLVFGIIHQFK